ncbi:MAG: NfeD family protein [Lapillicoccus sp.]
MAHGHAGKTGPTGAPRRGGEQVFDGYAWLAWVAAALALGAIEAATVDFVFLMLAGGALGGAAAAALGAGFPLQVVVAVAVSGVLLGVARPRAQARFTPANRSVMGTASYAGRSAIVTETVTGSSGRVKIGGDTWSAKALDGEEPVAGAEVWVVRIDGATAVVTGTPPALAS